MQYPQLNIVSHRRAKLGFTIVELLIVIVVIAILAAISIVAYTGIQDRARATAATSAARQVADKIAVYAVENDGYPASLSDIGFSDANGTSYQYRVNNGVTPATWCVTATAGNKSFYTSDAQGNPREGACAGHGVDGGAVVTNLVSNPSFATGTSGWSASSASVNRVISPWSADGNGSLRITASGQDSFSATYVAAVAGQAYTATAAIRIETPLTGSMAGSMQQRSIFLSFQNASGTHLGTGGMEAAPAVAPNAQGTYEVRATGIAPIGTARLTIRLYNGATTGSVYWDRVMVIEGSEPTGYGDGGSPGWTWNGTPNNSTSTGPPL